VATVLTDIEPVHIDVPAALTPSPFTVTQ